MKRPKNKPPYIEFEVFTRKVRKRFPACVAFFNPATLFDSGGSLLPMDEMPAEAQRALTGIEVEELFEFDRGSKHRTGNLRKIRFAGKMPALEFLAKHLGLLVDKHELTGKDGGPIQVVAVREALRSLLLRAEPRAIEITPVDKGNGTE